MHGSARARTEEAHRGGTEAESWHAWARQRPSAAGARAGEQREAARRAGHSKPGTQNNTLSRIVRTNHHGKKNRQSSRKAENCCVIITWSRDSSSASAASGSSEDAMAMAMRGCVKVQELARHHYKSIHRRALICFSGDAR